MAKYRLSKERMRGRECRSMFVCSEVNFKAKCEKRQERNKRECTGKIFKIREESRVVAPDVIIPSIITVY